MNQEIKNLEEKIRKTEDTTERLEALIQLCDNLQDSNPKRGLELAEEANRLAKEIGDDVNFAHSSRFMGVFKFIFGDYKEALELLRDAYEIFDDYNHLEGKASSLFSIGLVYRKLGDFSTALEYYEQSLKLAEELNDEPNISYVLNNIGIIYDILGDNQKALDYYFKALSELPEDHPSTNKARLLGNIGVTYYHLGEYEKSLTYQTQCYELAQKMDNMRGIANALNNLGILYIQLNDREKAREYFEKSLEVNETLGEKHPRVHGLLNVGRVWAESGNHAKGKTYFEKALDLATELESKELLYAVHEAFTELYKDIENYKKALEHHEKFNQLGNELFNKRSAETLRKMEVMHQVREAEKEAEIYRLKNVELAEMNQKLRDEIAQRKNAETFLLHLKKAIETTEIGVTIADLDGKIIYTNPADAKMHGYTVDELIGKNSNIFAKPELREDTSLMELEEIPNWKRERINIRKDGVEFPVELISNLIKENDGNPIGRVTICTDITERKKAQQILVESEQKLREANAAKDKFFSIIAHDLNNPLNGLLLCSEALEEHSRNFHYDEEQRYYIKTIKDMTERIKKLLQNLLEWSRAQTGKIKFDPESIELRHLIHNKIIFLAPLATSKAIDLSTDVQEKIYVRADLNMVETILRNLISNAIKFTPHNGSVTISAIEKENWVELSVSDTGIGIMPENMDKLFRIDTHHTTVGTDQEKGTGLGLIICKEFVEKHGGEIFVESEFGKGTTFTFTLPKNKRLL